MLASILLAALVAIGSATLLVGVLALLRARAARLDTGALFGLLATALEPHIKALEATLRQESRMEREELRAIFSQLQAAIEARLDVFGRQQGERLGETRREMTERHDLLRQGLHDGTQNLTEMQRRGLGDLHEAMTRLAERLEKSQADARTVQSEGFEKVAGQIRALTEDNDRRQERIRVTLTEKLEELRGGNEAKLEQMRATVDEKLQSTLEARLGESFKHVSERLEQVHKGLGEMQSLASGVGDLKRVLTSVRSRGAWGEVQLEMLLADLLTTEQLERNVRIRPDTEERVEFAIRLPGRDQDAVYLPIDSKFPHEDYDRLLAAHEAGATDEVERASQGLERAVRVQARTICEKYVHPPRSTDFAIMYLPTEGLFAELVRRPGLCAAIQRDHRVMLTGPTTLSALLTSLQMGFRTLAIEKRSSEVWKVLGAAKAEFGKYAAVWEQLGKQLATAQKTVEAAGTRTRAVERRLRDVEALPAIGEVSLQAIAAGHALADEGVDVRENLVDLA